MAALIGASAPFACRAANRPVLDTMTENEPSQYVSVTVLLVFGALTHQRDVPAMCEPLDEPQRELLPVILDGPTARIDRPIHEQFGSVAGRELRPRDSAS